MYIIRNVSLSITYVVCFQEACRHLADEYGETAPECGDAYYHYGQALLELARIENGVLGNALEGGRQFRIILQKVKFFPFFSCQYFVKASSLAVVVFVEISLLIIYYYSKILLFTNAFLSVHVCMITCSSVLACLFSTVYTCNMLG